MRPDSKSNIKKPRIEDSRYDTRITEQVVGKKSQNDKQLESAETRGKNITECSPSEKMQVSIYPRSLA